MIDPSEITDDQVREVEDAVGMACGAWDMVDPKEIIAASMSLKKESAYRFLEKGETIQEGDEVDACADPWRDNPVWRPAKCIGQPAPDPKYPSHRIYRRKVSERLQ